MKIILRCFIVIILLFFIETINAQISAVNSQTASQLVQNVLLGNGVTATNVKLNGTSVGANVLNAQIGYFDKATSNFPITKGIVMTSGLVSNIPGTANSFASSATGSGSDLDLVSISGVNIFDQVVLEFDFVATGDSMQFKYMFASEEYPEFVGGGVNDAFGFFLSGPGIFGSFLNGAVNLAHLPGGIVPVSINTVNQNINTSFYTSNANNFYGVTTKMDGMTVVMAALSALQCGETYHIKLALGDGGDAVYDSAVFLEAESFKSNVVKIEAESNLSNNFTDTLMAEGCVSTNLVFTRPTIYKDSPQKFYLNYGGTADPQLDFINLLDTIYFPSGEDTVSFLVTPMDDGLIEPMEYLDIFGYSVTICGDTIYDSIRLYIVDHYDLTYTLQDTVKAVCVQHQPQVTISNFDGSIGPFQYNWSFGGTTNPVNLPNSGATSDTIAYYVDVVDACGNVFPDSIVLVVESLVPTFGISPNKNFLSKCITDTPSVTATLINSTLPPYQFYWSTGSSTSSTTLPNNGVNYDTLYYAVQLTDGCGNTVKDSVRLTTNFAVPEFTISPNDTVYASCPSTLVNVTLANNNTSTYGPYIHDWSTGQSGIPVQLSNSGISGDRQWHYVVSTNSCGMNTMDSILVINNFTQPELSLSPNDTIVVDCLPDSALVTVSVDNNAVGPFTYSWSNGASGNSTYFHDNGVNGSSIPFTVTATDVCGFSTAKNGVLFVNKTLKIDSLGSSPSISCNSTGLVFAMVSGQKGPVSYKWTDGTGGQMNASSWGNRPSNWYYFTVTDVGCSVSDSVFVAVKDAPFALATATPSSGFSPLTVVFANQSLNTTSYYWDFGNGQNINTSSKAPITMVYSDSGVYTAMLISSQDNCADTFYVNIIVKQKPIVPPLVPTINNFDLPNVFTPNEDGSNDEFKLNTNGVKNVVLIIQNRWGNVVFEGSGVNPEWDGRTKSGDLAKEGVYLYQYEVTTIEDEVISGQGFVHLKRK